METKQKRSTSGKTTRRTASSGKPAGKRTAATQPKASAATRTKTTVTRKKVTAKQTPKRKPQRTSPEVVYTPPKPFNRGHLLLGLATAVAVVLALTFSVSIFFNVQNVMVSGAKKYDEWTIREASGIEEGDSLLGINEPKAAGLIQSALPYVDDVRIGIKLPDTVHIEIVELEVWYSIQDDEKFWWLITSDGRVVEQVDAATAGDCTKIKGVYLSMPVPSYRAVAAPGKPVLDENGETVPTVYSEADKLSAALSILQYLELNGIIGEAVSVDVTDMTKIELWYGQQYQVNLGDNTQLNYKIECLKKVIAKLPEYETGLIDLSFTIRPNEPVYDSFD